MSFFNQSDSASDKRKDKKKSTEVRFWKSAWFMTTVMMVFLVVAPFASADSSLIGGATPAQDDGGDGETPPAEGEDPLPEPPEEGETAPESEEAAPAEGETAPEGEEAAPAEGETAPEGEEAAPAEGETAPEGEEAAPAEGEAAPESEEAAPAEGETAPEGEEAAPAEGETAPESEEAAPAEEAAAPESEEAAPAEGESDAAAEPVGEAIEFASVENIISLTGFETAPWLYVLPEVEPAPAPEPEAAPAAPAAPAEPAPEAAPPAPPELPLDYSDKHPTMGNLGIRVRLPIQSDDNSVSWTRTLDQVEDWSEFSFVTMDVYAEQQVADMPFLQMTISSTLGTEQTVTMLPSQEIVQWENPSIIFPLDTVAPEVLANITAVSFTAAGYNDGLYGPAQRNLYIHVDNIRLDGSVEWESFERSVFTVQPSEIDTTLAGITGNAKYRENTGSLVLGWNSNEAGNAVATMIADTGQDWSNVAAVRGWMYAPNGELPVQLSLFDGTNTITTNPVVTNVADEWAPVYWAFPEAEEFDFSNVSRMSVSVSDLENFPEGTIFVDQLQTTVSLDSAYDVAVVSNSSGNQINWSNPLIGNAATISVIAGEGDFVSTAEDGILVCEVGTDVASTCNHSQLNPSVNYYYTVVANTAEGAVFSDASRAVPKPAPFLLSPAGANYSISINRNNGAIESIANTSTGELISQGNAGSAAWMLKFFDEATMPTLSAAEFSADSAGARFNLDEENGILHYFYDMDGDTATTEVHVQVELTHVNSNTFDWNMLVENNSGLTVRKVVMPHGMQFSNAGLERVYVPAWEGLAFEQDFFVETRNATFGRPTMFADLMAIEQGAGNLAFYTIQDSSYQAELIPGHNPEDVVIQPADYHIWGNGGSGYVAMEIGAAIPSGAAWNSATVRFHIDEELDEILDSYLAENNLDTIPSLAEKDVLFGQYDQMAESALLTLDTSAVSAETGQTWTTIRDSVIRTLPQNAIVQFSRWQNGGADAEGNLLAPSINQDLPIASIWTDQHGSIEELQSLLDTMNARGIMAAPYIDWTVWNQLEAETGELPLLDNTADALRSSTAAFPALQDDGYVLKSWSDGLRTRNDGIISQLSEEITLDLIYSEMSGADRWRYSYLDDASQPSASAYTQGIINETNRLGAGQPLIVGAMMDQLAGSAVGFAGSVRQEETTGVLRHLGSQNAAWNTYPLAAMMMHDKVAFYPNPTQNARPTASRSEFTYYTVMGYNLAEQTSAVTGGRAFWAPMVSTFQEVVNSRTFGEEMVSYRELSADGKQVESVFGSGRNKVTISANFDLDASGGTANVGGYSISPDGFHAYAADGSMVAGVYLGQFNGNGLTEGRHWITVEHVDKQIEVRQPFGADTDLMIDRPRNWRNADLISMVQVMDNGRAIPVEVTDVLPDRILISYTGAIENLTTDRFVLYYGRLDNGFDVVASLEALTAEQTIEEIVIEAEAPAEGATESGEGVTEGDAAESAADETVTEDGESTTAGDEGGETSEEAADGSETTEEAADGGEASEEAADGGEATEEAADGGETTEEAAEGETPPETADESETPPETADEPVEGEGATEGGESATEGGESATEGGESATEGDEGATEGESTEGSSEGDTPSDPDPSEEGGADSDGTEGSTEGDGVEDPAEGSESEAPEGDGN